MPTPIAARRLSVDHSTKLGGALVFGGALLLYVRTVAPSVALWDSGEFIASAFGLQVMHPPGAPLYVLLGRLATMLSGAEHAALAVNLLSVIAASATALLAYLIIIRLVRRIHGEVAWPGIAGAVIGAFTLVVSDTFWFNAVEAEVYAFATLFICVIVWLALRWADALSNSAPSADQTRMHRYLVLIALLFGLSIGIHLMSVLTFFFIVPLVYFTLFDRPGWTAGKRSLKVLAAFAAGCIAFAAIYPGMVITLPEVADRLGSPLGALIVLSIVLTAGLLITHRRQMPLANLLLLCVTAMMVGYSSYALIPIRSAADPEIDLNDPETPAALVSYLKREQYGQRPLLRSATFDDRTGRVEPEHEAYFPRRNSPDPPHLALYARYDSDLDYFTRYQLGHMYARYFMWNFVGRAHDTQHAGWITGLEREETLAYNYQTPSERESRNRYFALPLLLGLLGMGYHFSRDWRSACCLGALFAILGVGLVLYLNEIPATPRERDYIYVGSFMVFCLWIGMGAAFVVRTAIDALRSGRAVLGTFTAILLAAAVPGWMGVQNFGDHDRTGNLAARDYAFNLLMSVEEDAILFTGGDNDTYPLWYLQAVEGVRRDVRVVCLPLLQTSWYAKQLKNQTAYDAGRVAMAMSDEQLDALHPVAWEPREIALPVDEASLLDQPALRTSVEDTNGFEIPMRWRLEGRPYSESVRYLAPSDQVILDVLATNARRGWERPVYFATSSPTTDRLGLEPYLQQEGLAYRVVPIRHDRQRGRIVPSIMLSRLGQFRFTRLDDPDVYYADDVRSLLGFHYRLAFTQAADTLIEEQEPEKAKQLLARLMDEVPGDTIPLHPFQAASLGRSFLRLGAPAEASSVVTSAAPRLLRDLRYAESRSALQTHLQIAQALRQLLLEADDYEAASHFSNELAAVLNDQSLRMSPDELRRRHAPDVPSG